MQSNSISSLGELLSRRSGTPKRPDGTPGPAEGSAPGTLVGPSGGQGEAGRAGLSIRHVLVPLDGSPLAECALPWAVAVAQALAARVTLLRDIGPALTSGRIADLAVDPVHKGTYYVAVASGGVWKTTNQGTTFTPVFDKEGSYSIGCVTLDPSNPLVVWVGTGENNSQRPRAASCGARAKACSESAPATACCPAPRPPG